MRVYRATIAVSVFLLNLVSLTLTNAFSFAQKTRKNVFPQKKKTTLIYHDNEVWNDGEVPWDFPNNKEEKEDKSYSLVQLVDTNQYPNNQDFSSTREKIWLFLEEIKWKARVSGALNGMYVQVGTGDVIMNQLEDFDNCDVCNTTYDKLGTHIENKMRSVNNYNTEFEFLLTMATFLSYRIYKNIELEDLKNEIDMPLYFKIRRQSILFTLCMLLIFTKNVKNAI